MSSSATPPALSLAHLSRPPRVQHASGQPPLIVLLHGVGSNERDLFGFAPVLDPRFHIVSVRAPLVRGPDSFAWFDVRFLPDGFAIDGEHLRQSRDRIVQFVGEAVAAYGADPARVYLLGFSQGAIMSLTTALSTPALVAGIAPLAGRIPPEARPWIAPPDALAGLPILLVHGRRDTVISLRFAHEARELLLTLPVALTYREYDMAHEITERTLADVTEWLSARLDGPRREPPTTAR